MKLNKVKIIRIKRQMTQDQLAKKVNQSIDTIKTVESGLAFTDFVLAYQLSLVLQVSLKDLFPLEYSWSSKKGQV